MACLKDSRLLYNEMLEQSKAAYAQMGKFLFKYDLKQRFAGRGGDTIPGSTVQMPSDRLEKALKRYLSHKEQGGPGGFPRFKTPNRWHRIPLRQHQKDFCLHEDGKHLCVPGKLGLRLKIKMHHMCRKPECQWDGAEPLFGKKYLRRQLGNLYCDSC